MYEGIFFFGERRKGGQRSGEKKERIPSLFIFSPISSQLFNVRDICDSISLVLWPPTFIFSLNVTFEKRRGGGV